MLARTLLLTAESDPVLDAALAEPRKRPATDRKPGKRE